MRFTKISFLLSSLSFALSSQNLSMIFFSYASNFSLSLSQFWFYSSILSSTTLAIETRLLRVSWQFLSSTYYLPFAEFRSINYVFDLLSNSVFEHINSFKKSSVSCPVFFFSSSRHFFAFSNPCS